MKTLMILDKLGGEFTETVSTALSSLGNVKILARSTADRLCQCDLVVVSPDYGLAPLPEKCVSLLVPDDYAIDAPGCITYGMAGTSALTLSSIGDGTSMMTVARSIETPTGGVIEPQELRVASISDIHTTLAVAGGQLLLGIGKP